MVTILSYKHFLLCEPPSMYENIQLIKVKLFQGNSVQWTRPPVGTVEVILFYMCAFNYLVLQQLSTSSALELKKNL